MANFREIFNVDQRELLAECVAFYEKHCISQAGKQIDSANVKSVEKIQQWHRKENAVKKLFELLQEESF